MIIIGGGITGLSAAYIAAKQGVDVTVLEANTDFGGLLNTFEIAGTRLEYFYHHFFTHDAEIMWLIKELGLESELVFKKSTMGVFREGKIFEFNNPTDLFRFTPITLTDKLKFGFSSLYLGKIAKWQSYEDTNALHWLQKWAGKSTTANLWKPLLDIKFGPYASEIPLSWMVGRMRQRLSSREKGEEKLGYMRGSLHVLLQRLLAELRKLGVRLLNEHAVSDVEMTNGCIKKIVTKQGDLFEANKFLFTVPTNLIAKWLEKSALSLSNLLSKTEYFGAVCVILEMNNKLSDTYWLNVADKGFPFGGIIEHTNLIDSSNYNGKHIAYLSRYFAKNEEIAKMDSAAIQELMLPCLKKIYPKFSLEQIENVFVFKTNTAATVCDLNFSKKVPPCKTDIEGLYIANMNHIYPDERSTNNAIRVAAEACASMGFSKIKVPKNASLSAQIGFNS